MLGKNLHPYIGWTDDDPTLRHIIRGVRSKWLHTQACTHETCPKCGSELGYHCQTPKGREAWPPHTARLLACPS